MGWKAPQIEWPLPGVTLDQMIERADPALPRYPDADRLYAKIGQLNMELDWLKKKSGISL